MCFSGKCKYERWDGDCFIPDGGQIPDDAVCALGDKEKLIDVSTLGNMALAVSVDDIINGGRK